MERYSLRIIAIAISGIMVSATIFIVGLSLFIDLYNNGFPQDPNYQYTIDVNRTSEENVGMVMIKIAEGYNYSEIFNESPIDDGFIFMLKETEGRANFIYDDNLDHYLGRVRSLEENHTYGHYKVEYTAEARRFDEIELRLRSEHDPDYRSSGLYYGEDHVSFIEYMSSYFLYDNGTDLVQKNYIGPPDSDITYNRYYEDCFIIEMKLEYSAYSKPDEGGGFILGQYVVLSQSGDLLVFFNHRIDSGVLRHQIGSEN